MEMKEEGEDVNVGREKDVKSDTTKGNKGRNVIVTRKDRTQGEDGGEIEEGRC